MNAFTVIRLFFNRIWGRVSAMFRPVRWTWSRTLCVYICIYICTIWWLAQLQGGWTLSRKMLDVPRGRLLVDVICYWALRHSGSWMLVNGEIWCVDYPFPFSTLKLPSLTSLALLFFPSSLPTNTHEKLCRPNILQGGCSFFHFIRLIIVLQMSRTILFYW